MGDDGRLYVPEDAAAVYGEAIVPLASVLTPNQFEAERLTGREIGSEADALAVCRALHAQGPATVVRLGCDLKPDARAGGTSGARHMPWVPAMRCVSQPQYCDLTCRTI